MAALVQPRVSRQGRGSGDTIFGDRFTDPLTVLPPDPIRVLNRLTFGATEALTQEFQSLGSSIAQRTSNYVDQQLSPASINDAVCDARIQDGQFESLGKTLSQQWQEYHRASGADRSRPLNEVEAIRIIRASCSRRQVLERMVEFWHDHFNVLGTRDAIRSVFMHYDRDVIRQHALGNFRAMLEETARSTAMLYYLDNRNSRVAGFNENYARELIELHTMGADVYYPTIDPTEVPPGPDGRPLGYCDNDVYAAARCLTGWTVYDDSNQPENDTGEFRYRADWHDAAQKYFLGEFILANRPDLEDGRTVFDRLCSHRATARYLCQKLIRRFITDEPDPAMVESAAAVWQQHWQAPDQIARVLRHILTASNLLSTSEPKLRRPFELVIGALRMSGSIAVPAVPSGGTVWNTIFNRFNGTGHRSFRWAPPDGFPDRAIDWLSASSLGMTWRMLSDLVELDRDNAPRPPIIPVVAASLQQFPVHQRTARKLLNWWLDRMLGYQPAPARYQELLDFMRQNADPDAPLDLERGGTDGSFDRNNLSEHYVKARLRTLIGLICMLPEFQVR